MTSVLASFHVILTATLLGSLAQAQPEQLPEPLYEEGFERGVGSWSGIGESAKISRAIDATQAHLGASALRFNYAVAAKQVNLLATSVVPPSVATLQSISFWLKSDRDASFIFVIQEQNGGRFNSEFSVVKDEWQYVVITPEELHLQSGTDDPKDNDGVLSLDKVGSFALVDFEQIFAQIAGDVNSPAAKLLGVKTGPRSLFLDDFLVSSKLTTYPLLAPGVIDDFSRPQPRWFSVGEAKLKIVPAEKPETQQLAAEYTQQKGMMVTLVKLFAPGTLTGKTALQLKLKSKQHATILVQLEETGGGKYNVILDVAGESKTVEKTLEFNSFKPADDSKDDNGQLDMSAVKQLSLIDASGMLGVDGVANILRLIEIKPE